MTDLVFLDTETTGLDSAWDEIWDIAWTVRSADGTENHYQEFVKHDVNKAMLLPDAFRKDWGNRYEPTLATTPRNLASRLTGTIPQGAHLVGACPWFDQAFLEPIFRSYYTRPSTAKPPFKYGWLPWHYHLIDVEALAVGYLSDTKNIMNGAQHDAITPPWDSNDLSLMLGVDPDTFPRHTASGDVAWAMAMYDAILPPPE